MPPFGVLAEREMARFSTHLTDTEVADVINFVRSSFGNHYRDAITPQQVAALPHTGAAQR
jgi:mono/diheme cytochrome c family protein